MRGSMGQNGMRLAGIVGVAAGLALAAGPARANVMFDFSSLAGNGQTCTSGDCVLNGNTATYTAGGINVTAYSYALTNSVVSSSGTDVSQRFGSNTAETGLGVFTSGVDSRTGSPLEISSSEYLLLDNSNAISQGYIEASISLGSIQSGEGGSISIYGTSSIGSTLDLTKLTLLAKLQNPSTGSGALQKYNFSFSNDTANYLVITADNTTASAGNVLVQQETFANGSSNIPVPEPMSVTVLATGLLGLTLVRRRSHG
jgi:hypothetical protein